MITDQACLDVKILCNVLTSEPFGPFKTRTPESNMQPCMMQRTHSVIKCAGQYEHMYCGSPLPMRPQQPRAQRPRRPIGRGRYNGPWRSTAQRQRWGRRQHYAQRARPCMHRTCTGSCMHRTCTGPARGRASCSCAQGQAMRTMRTCMQPQPPTARQQPQITLPHLTSPWVYFCVWIVHLAHCNDVDTQKGPQQCFVQRTQSVHTPCINTPKPHTCDTMMWEIALCSCSEEHMLHGRLFTASDQRTRRTRRRSCRSWHQEFGQYSKPSSCRLHPAVQGSSHADTQSMRVRTVRRFLGSCFPTFLIISSSASISISSLTNFSYLSCCHR